jgi:hypothetical protein
MIIEGNRFMQKLSVVLLFMLLLLSLDVRAEEQGMEPLSEVELASLCGGLELPNGMNVNIGIENQVSVNGQVVANAQFSLNGTTIQTTASGTWHIQAADGATDILQLAALGPTVVTNTANNLTLAQQRVINVDVTNFTQMHLQSLQSLSLVQAQAINGLRNGLH